MSKLWFSRTKKKKHFQIKKIVKSLKEKINDWDEKRYHKNINSENTQKISVYPTLISVKAMAPHSSTLVWRIPGMGEPGGLSSMGSHRVRHD